MKKSLLMLPLMLLLIVSAFSIQPARAQAAPSVQSVDISGAISGSATTITYDGANNAAWISVGVSQSNLYKVNLLTVIAQGAAAVTGFTSLLPQTVGGHPEYGSLAGGPFASTILGSSIYVTAIYSNNYISVGQVSTASGALTNQWFYSGPSTARGITNDGTSLYVTTSSRILKLTTGGVFTSLGSTSTDTNGIILVGSKLYFTMASANGLGSVNTDGSAYTEYACGCTSTAFLVSVGSNIWLTSNTAHTLIKYDGAAFTAYPTGISGDGPYGIQPTATGLWLSGYGGFIIRFFSFALSAIDSTDDVVTTKKAFNGFTDNLNLVWNMALGSTSIIKITPGGGSSTSSSSSTTTTQATTSMEPVGVTAAIVLTSPTLLLSKANTTTITGFMYLPTYMPGTFKSLTWTVISPYACGPPSTCPFPLPGGSFTFSAVQNGYICLADAFGNWKVQSTTNGCLSWTGATFVTFSATIPLQHTFIAPNFITITSVLDHPPNSSQFVYGNFVAGVFAWYP